ncbi:MAG TPA: metal-dependent hydrolase, partial [Arenibaculum sp.]|nr:metal-dependent hydrolase [Arenibaculum sp.]
MDTVTQALFGAAVAQAGFRRRLGRRAIVAGAVLGVVPDLDVVAGWFGPVTNWIHHRGITHSLFFAPVLGPLVGWAIWRILRDRERRGARIGGAASDEARASWMWLCLLVLVTHPVIDLFTSYGTQLLAPLSRHRFAIDAMPIIEPVYSLALLVAVLVGAFARNATRATVAAAASLFFVSAYTLYGWSINERIETQARLELARAGSAGAEVRAYPMLFQPWYRRVVAHTPDAVLIGFHSSLSDGPIGWQSFSRVDDPRVTTLAGTWEAGVFSWFAMDQVYWTVSSTDDGGATVAATDLRYGMPGGTELGFWGIRGRLDATGSLTGPPEVFRRRPEATRGAWA